MQVADRAHVEGGRGAPVHTASLCVLRHCGLSPSIQSNATRVQTARAVKRQWEHTDSVAGGRGGGRSGVEKAPDCSVEAPARRAALTEPSLQGQERVSL